MKVDFFMFQLQATKMFTPELDKGEKNPYTTGDEIGNPYMKDIKIDVKEKDMMDILNLLDSKGYDTSQFEKIKEVNTNENSN